MRKFIVWLTVWLMSAAMVLAFAGCGAPAEEQPEDQVEYKIAMVTDSGLILDGGYSQVAWTAISDFGAAKGISHKYYKAAEATEESYQATIDNAVAKGAEVIVADGYSFEDVVYNAQNQYSDVKFILIDAEPVDAESGKAKIADNTMAILFSSEQAGYLAGYAAVKDGFRQLGFMGSEKIPMIMDYGYGFLQGAEAAADEMKVEIGTKHHYCAKDEDRNAIADRAARWYEEGTEVIFACGPAVDMPVIEAAELLDKKVICCETDKSQMSDTVITSAVKDIGAALELVLDQYDDDAFPGGEIVSYDVENEGVRLELENGRFTDFAKDDYNVIRDDLAAGNIQVKDHTAGDIGALGLARVNVVEE